MYSVVDFCFIMIKLKMHLYDKICLTYLSNCVIFKIIN